MIFFCNIIVSIFYSQCNRLCQFIGFLIFVLLFKKLLRFLSSVTSMVEIIGQQFNKTLNNNLAIKNGIGGYHPLDSTIFSTEKPNFQWFLGYMYIIGISIGLCDGRIKMIQTTWWFSVFQSTQFLPILCHT